MIGRGLIVERAGSSADRESRRSDDFSIRIWIFSLLFFFLFLAQPNTGNEVLFQDFIPRAEAVNFIIYVAQEAKFERWAFRYLSCGVAVAD